MKCIIVDDEPIARRGMKRLVDKRPELTLLGEFGSAEEAMEYLATNPVDLIFLDIQMPGTSGMEFARQIPKQTLVIFTTAYSEYAVDSYEVEAIDYIMKPIQADRFDKAVDKAIAYYKLMQQEAESPQTADTLDYIIVKADGRFHRVKLDDIRFVEGLKDYAIIQLDGRRIVTRMTLKGMEDLLPADKFMRVNKSYIVNFDYVDSFNTLDLFIGDTEIAIGPSYRDAVQDRLLK